MKKLAFLFIAFFSLCITSCNQKVEGGQVADSDSVATDSLVQPVVAKTDTITTQNISAKRKLGCWEYESRVAYPVDGSETLLASIRNWISESLRISADPEKRPVAFSGNKNDGKSMLEYYAKQYLSSINYDDYVDLPEDMGCAMDFYITKEFENSEVVSFNLQTYWFGGGAHGGTTISGATFRKSDGKQMGWDMIASKKALRSEIIKGLKDYLEVNTDDELMESLLLMTDDGAPLTISEIPYPQTTPWLSSEGLVIIYQQYEICSYAQGMPVVIIPWTKLKKYLSTACQSFIRE